MYEGQFDNDRRSGYGCQTYQNGDRYKGQWVNGKRHGKGRLVHASGDVFEGTFYNGKREGLGVLMRPSKVLLCPLRFAWDGNGCCLYAVTLPGSPDAGPKACG